MPQPRRIYLLDPKHLSPETIAVAFAKTSRSPQSFDEIAAELSDEKSADFMKNGWLVTAIPLSLSTRCCISPPKTSRAWQSNAWNRTDWPHT